MTIPEDFKTRLKIAKSKIKKQVTSDNENKNSDKKTSLLGVAFKMSTELVAAVLVGSIIGFIFDFAIFRRVLKSSGVLIVLYILSY